LISSVLLLTAIASSWKMFSDGKLFYLKPSTYSGYLGLKVMAGGSKSDQEIFLIIALWKAIRALVFGHPAAVLPRACGVPPGCRRALLSCYSPFPEVQKVIICPGYHAAVT